MTDKRNRIVVFQGKRMSLTEACGKASISRDTVYSRLRRGWAITKALKSGPQAQRSGWIPGRRRSEANKAKCRVSQQRRRAREQDEKIKKRQEQYEQFLSQIPSIRVEPLLMTRQFYDNNKETEQV